jgi:uncharacterized metal-binding protein YceD (DUF177 family)
MLTHSPTNPEFARVVPVGALRRAGRYTVDVAPEPNETRAIAALVGADAVEGLRLTGTVHPDGDGWRLEGRLVATAVQPCVVTLEPVTTAVDVSVRRRFQPVEPPQVDEVEIDSAEDDIEPLGDRIDLGLVAIEALVLALPAYPRAPGAEAAADALEAAAAEPDTEAAGDGRPFAALAALKSRLDEGP